jgi:hypothetical protein
VRHRHQHQIDLGEVVHLYIVWVKEWNIWT